MGQRGMVQRVDGIEKGRDEAARAAGGLGRELAGDTHDEECRGEGGEAVPLHGEEGACQCRGGAAHGGDPVHQWAAVGEPYRPLAVGDQVDGAGGSQCEPVREGVAGGEGLDLGAVAPDRSCTGGDQLAGQGETGGAALDLHRIEEPGPAELAGGGDGRPGGCHARRLQHAEIDDEGGTGRDEVRLRLRIGRHARDGSGRQQQVGGEGHRYGVGEAMDTRALLADTRQQLGRGGSGPSRIGPVREARRGWHRALDRCRARDGAAST